MEAINQRYLFKLKNSNTIKKLVNRHYCLDEWLYINKEWEAKEDVSSEAMLVSSTTMVHRAACRPVSMLSSLAGSEALLGKPLHQAPQCDQWGIATLLLRAPALYQRASLGFALKVGVGEVI